MQRFAHCPANDIFTSTMSVLMIILKILGVIVYYLTMLLGILLVPLGLPGEFLVVLATGVFILVAGGEVMGWWVLVVLVLLGILAEVIEFLAGMVGAKAKGSLWSGVGAVAGGLAGSIIGAPFGLIIGSLAGAFIGTFAGAYLVELYISRHSIQAANVAGTALFARLVGTAVKVAISIIMIIIVTFALVF